jgi:hypothetical protein
VVIAIIIYLYTALQFPFKRFIGWHNLKTERKATPVPELRSWTSEVCTNCRDKAPCIIAMNRRRIVNLTIRLSLPYGKTPKFSLDRRMTGHDSECFGSGKINEQGMEKIT